MRVFRLWVGREDGERDDSGVGGRTFGAWWRPELASGVANMSPAERSILSTVAERVRPFVTTAPNRVRTMVALARRGYLESVAVGGHVGFTATPNGRRALAKSKKMAAYASERGADHHQPKPEKWAYAQSLRDAGWTLDAIGASLGCTRERVRQKTLGRGQSGSAHPVDPIKLTALLRDPTVTSLAIIVERTGHSTTTLRECYTALGLLPAALRLMRWRRIAPTRRRYAALILREYERLGRTPTTHELSAAMGMNPTASAPILGNVFGSVRRAMEYVGIEPRSPGGPGHLVARRRGPTCTKCGTPWHVTKSGFEYCKVCSYDAKRRYASSVATTSAARHPKTENSAADLPLSQHGDDNR